MDNHYDIGFIVHLYYDNIYFSSIKVTLKKLKGFTESLVSNNILVKNKMLFAWSEMEMTIIYDVILFIWQNFDLKGA